jgi:hypothetical protein
MKTGPGVLLVVFILSVGHFQAQLMTGFLIWESAPPPSLSY